MRLDAAVRAQVERQRGPKHDFWVVPYADMMTLLFALFVVLYAMGEVRLQKLQELRRSLSTAFRVGSAGYDEAGDFDLGPIAAGGELVDGFELVTTQSGPMKKYLLETLPAEFRELSGRSLEIVLTDDTVVFEAPLSGIYEPGATLPREDVQLWMVRLFEGAFGFTSSVRVRIEAPDVVLDRDGRGRTIRSDAACAERLVRLRDLLRRMPQVEDRQVTTEFKPALPVLSGEDWEASATISFAFSNR